MAKFVIRSPASALAGAAAPSTTSVPKSAASIPRSIDRMVPSFVAPAIASVHDHPATPSAAHAKTLPCVCSRWDSMPRVPEGAHGAQGSGHGTAHEGHHGQAQPPPPRSASELEGG